MRWDVIGLVIGWTLRIFAVPLTIVGLYSIYADGLEFAIKTYAITLLVAFAFSQWLISKVSGSEMTNRVRDREAFAAVALGWPPVVLLGAIPFWLGGMFNGPFEFFAGDANLIEMLRGALHSWFESMSGFTTTGATVIDPSSSPNCVENVEDCIASQPKSLLLWRSLTQWLGGMGVIMLGLVILSRVLGGGASFARAELTGPTLSKLGPTLQSTARRLWTIYIFLTILEMGALYFIGGLGYFDSVNYALTTLPTGGFGVTDGGVMDITSSSAVLILTIFMILAGINFSLYHVLAMGNPREAFKDEELRTYLLIFLLAWLGMAFSIFRSNLDGPSGDEIESLRQSMFQAASIGTSTGYASANFAEWPVFSQIVLLLLMIIGASAGSTGGGVKVLRVRISFELARREITRIIFPRKVVAMRVNGEVIDENRIWIVLGMLSSWVVLATGSMLLLSMIQPQWEMNDVLSVVISSLGNTGPALGQFGPTSTWASMNDLSLFWTSILMWLGRLELLTVLVLLHPRTWSSSN
ncbi:MAG: TrkH family potassium uptake protein [Candidatus Thalassarchaeaceae archaeon]|jgi:trk system potassium uptake protein TrkH|nr:TrkH family potassium uptake protein [Candidatus Thalassarchaeaceae archaeon]HJM29545.1 TrkH family potassium uptake protein [Candidatus Thalassarchaeaceae archaeon]HJN70122.1 TrkH family potassium uptake protein [Candidatus Thalassarchaeaceae archaeon]